MLRSWAVPKGPSTDPREKRLADRGRGPPARLRRLRGRDRRGHTAPGAVIVWDAGTYRNLDEERSMAEALDGRPRSSSGSRARSSAAAGRSSARAAAQAAVAADQAPRRGRRRPAQPEEHAARVGQDRAHHRAGRARSAEDARPRRSTRSATTSAALAPAPAPKAAGAMKAVLTDERFSRPGLDLRAQARRHPLHRDPVGTRREAAVAQRPSPQRPLPGARRRRSAPRRATGFASTARSSRSTARRRASRRLAQRGHRRRSHGRSSTSFDLLCARRPRRARAAAARRASGCCATRSPSSDGVRCTPHRNGTARRSSREACRKGWEGADRQARRQPVPRDALATTG